MEYELRIIEGVQEEATVFDFDNQLFFTFNSLKSYLKFIEHPQILKYNFNKFHNKKYKWLKNNINDFIKNIHTLPLYIVIEDEPTDDFSSLPNQQICFDIKIEDYNKMIKVINALPSENCLFKDRFNFLEYQPKEKIIRGYHKIDETINSIKSLNLSPAEKIYILYDFTRGRLYKKSNDTNTAISRDLAHVMQEDEIVCAGFANIFGCLATALNIYYEPLYWQSEKGTYHKTSLIYLNDDKYDIHGLFSFDPTAGCKKRNEDIDYVNNISEAFIPFEMEILRKEEQKYTLDLTYSQNSTNLKALFMRVERYNHLKNLNAPKCILKGNLNLIKDTINNICSLIGIEPIREIEETLDFHELLFMLCHLIPINTFKNIILTSRSVENSIDPVLYPNNESIINQIIVSSYSYRISRQFKLLRTKLNNLEKKE